MWWRPPRAGPDDLDPRLAPFRERGGRLFGDDGTLVAEVYLQPEVWWTGGGWLWWRKRPEPVEVVNAYVIDAQGSITDEYTYPSETLDEAVAKWSTGTFELDDDQFLQVVWPNDEESAALRDRAGFDVADL